MDLQIIGANICILCAKRNISAEALAEAIGKSPRQVIRYRNGQCKNISYTVLKQIADALETDLDVLLHQ